MNTRERFSFRFDILTAFALILIISSILLRPVKKEVVDPPLSDFANRQVMAIAVEQQTPSLAILVLKEDRQNHDLWIKILDDDYRWGESIKITYDFKTTGESLAGRVGFNDSDTGFLYFLDERRSGIVKEKIGQAQKTDSLEERKRIIEEMIQGIENKNQPPRPPSFHGDISILA